MTEKVIYQALAEAFVREGVDTHFTLMGTGQMHWAIAMSKMPGMKTVHARHEQSACAMAIGYHFATGKAGIASVTCGPGFTQTITALTSAVHAKVPLIILAADTPAGSRWYLQDVDQSALTKATGAHYIAGQSPQLMLAYVQEAFYVANYQRRPVVLSIPYDLMKLPLPQGAEFPASSAIIPKLRPTPPNTDDVVELAALLAGAKRPIVIAGRGAVASGAGQAIEDLADATGALLATTLPARGLFDHHPFSIGIAGGYSREIAVETFAGADFVLAVGASLTHYTVNGGKLFPQATVAQVDREPLGLQQGRRAADFYVKADAKLTAEAVLHEVKGRPVAATIRTPELAAQIVQRADDSTEVDIEKELLDPRLAVRALDDVVPRDWEVVSGTGHCAYFYAQMRNRSPKRFHVLREFGAIGSSLAMAIGVAAAKGDGKVMLIDGDGGVLMYAQELETIRRQGIKLLICVLNDGAYGAEIHKLRNEGVDDSPAQFGRPDFSAIARGFGLQGSTVKDLGDLPRLFNSYSDSKTAEIWDFHISDRVVSPALRKYTGHG
ncbi:acetolactate synthase I/II/III large subunit [Agaricicola taiwanensis]|uniref:Acetolactate synthase I/II/III large subunit n=1 Tax=Agaricicola taiwanensis TaxID=591372 RepID=A0A8J3DXG3_9RHOB|nr:thiamine pyrophosphate-binding protein [Agaricicola taiwanensis]GGE45597.1 acetolactate synthase I/II/III large subunit [Agaricicola taiwanensis]